MSPSCHTSWPSCRRVKKADLQSAGLSEHLQHQNHSSSSRPPKPLRPAMSKVPHKTSRNTCPHVERPVFQCFLRVLPVHKNTILLRSLEWSKIFVKRPKTLHTTSSLALKIKDVVTVGRGFGPRLKLSERKLRMTHPETVPSNFGQNLHEKE